MSITINAYGLEIPIEGVTQEEFDEFVAFMNIAPDENNKRWLSPRAASTFDKLSEAMCMTKDEWYATPGMDDFVPPEEAKQRLINRYSK